MSKEDWDQTLKVEKEFDEIMKLRAENERLKGADGMHMAMEETIHRLTDESERLSDHIIDLDGRIKDLSKEIVIDEMNSNYRAERSPTAYICFNREGRGQFRGDRPCCNPNHTLLKVIVLHRKGRVVDHSEVLDDLKGDFTECKDEFKTEYE